jgi:hypothetical protein
MRRPRKKSNTAPLRTFIATWTRSQVYRIRAVAFDGACEKALANRTLYTPHTVERLTIHELHRKEST